MSLRMTQLLPSLLLLTLTSPTTVAQSNGPSFRSLGRLPNQQNGGFRANGVSADGTVVVGYFSSVDSDSGLEAFRWTQQTGLVGLGDLPGDPFQSSANAVSADGSIVVGKGISNSSGRGDFRWSLERGMENLTGSPSTATDISADGSVIVGGWQPGTVGEAFRWTEATGTIGLGDLLGGSVDAFAYAVSSDGSFVVGYSDSGSNPDEAFLWDEINGMVGLGGLTTNSFSSRALDVSDDGTIVVGFGTSNLGSVSGQEAFIWDAKNGMIGLGDLPGGPVRSQANAVSGDGLTIVGYSATDSIAPFEAFIWNSSTSMRNLKDLLVNDLGLDLTGWSLWSASDISSDGLFIVGYGTNPSGRQASWIVDLGCLSDNDCDDGIDCTVDSCNLATHICTQQADDAMCDDELYCNGAERCDTTSGCLDGTPACDDGISCTDDSCDEAAKACSNLTQDANCTDGVFCNGMERCHPTLDCISSVSPDCDDSNDCTNDSCNPDSDSCEHLGLTDGTACEDGFFCTIDDSCLNSVCESGPVNTLCVGTPGTNGQPGTAGSAGAAGLSCWDLNGNSTGDTEEDINEDGDFNALDCVGATGPEGERGPRGPAGLSCWDLNGNGVGDPGEDTNGDGDFDALDCQGRTGRACENDEECQDGLFCNGIEICEDNICTTGQLPCDLENETCLEDVNRCVPSDNPPGQTVPDANSEPSTGMCGAMSSVAMIMMFMGLATFRFRY